MRSECSLLMMVPFMVISEKREGLLRAALELVAEHGFHGAPIQRIPNHAGVGMGTVYRYFRNKNALIARGVSKNP